MKLAYFSPLGPQRSGISDYSEELLPYLAATLWLTSAFGLTGTALAWTGRAFVELAVLTVLTARLLGRPVRLPANRSRRALYAVAALALGSVVVAATAGPSLVRIGAGVAVIAAFVLGTWRYVIDPADRRAIRGAFGFHHGPQWG